MQARPRRAGRATKPELAREPHENAVHCGLVRRPAGFDNKQVVASTTQPVSDREIVAQSSARCRVKRQKTALAELAAPDNETVVGEMIASQSQRFGDAQTR